MFGQLEKQYFEKEHKNTDKRQYQGNGPCDGLQTGKLWFSKLFACISGGKYFHIG
jgi:hypothetical protein